jgi:transglycosylase-like protein with SLT domain
MSPKMNNLMPARAELVYVLPLAQIGMTATRKHRQANWKSREDFRIICDCQRHARQERSLWRRTLRIATRGVALLVGVPLAVVAFDFPTAAMDANLESLRRARAPQVKATVMPMFDSPRTKEQFLAPGTTQRTFDLEIVKEQFFASHVPYGAIIYREAKKNNLPPELVAAMVETESDFRPGLVSHKNAQGLMQIVPETAKILGVRDVYDPEQNIAAGTKYFSYLMRRFRNQRTALAAYNAGETKVAREGIPQYPETLGYIEKVDRRARKYQRRLQSTILAASRMHSAVH